MSNKSLRADICRAIGRMEYEVTGLGLLLPKVGVLAAGEYFDRINGGAWQRTKNLVVTEGLAFILSVALGATAKPTALYIGLFSGSTAPTASWTAAQFASVASEITSLTEGYTNATRPIWTPPDSVSTGSIDNLSSVASVTMATTSSFNVTGAALLTNSTRGGTTGSLISATKYSTARTFQDGDTYEIGYRLTLSV